MDSGKQAGLLLPCFVTSRLGFNRCCRIDIVDLQPSGFRVDDTFFVFGPFVGPVVMVHPQQHVDIARFRLFDNAPVGLVDAHGSQAVILELSYLFIMDALGSRVHAKLRYEIKHLVLLLLGYCSKGIHEVRGYSGFVHGGHLVLFFQVVVQIQVVLWISQHFLELSGLPL